MLNNKGKLKPNKNQTNRDGNSTNKPPNTLDAIKGGFWSGIGKSVANEFMKIAKRLFSSFNDDDPPSGSAGAFVFDLEA